MGGSDEHRQPPWPKSKGWRVRRARLDPILSFSLPSYLNRLPPSPLSSPSASTASFTSREVQSLVMARCEFHSKASSKNECVEARSHQHGRGIAEQTGWTATRSAGYAQMTLASEKAKTENERPVVVTKGSSVPISCMRDAHLDHRSSSHFD